MDSSRILLDSGLRIRYFVFRLPISQLPFPSTCIKGRDSPLINDAMTIDVAHN